MRTASWIAALLLAAGPAARAEETSGAATLETYPFAVRITLSPERRRAFLLHTAGGFSAPPHPSCEVLVGQQAADAYAAAARRMFGGDPRATAELDVSMGGSAFAFDADGWHAVVEHHLVLRLPDGAELGRWTVSARELVAPFGETAIPRAFARAAARAALRFEAAIEEPEGVQRWLREHGIEPGARRRPAVPADPGPAALTRPSKGPPRSWGFYADVGGGFHIGGQREAPATLPVLEGESVYSGTQRGVRVGVSGRSIFLQVAHSRAEAGIVRHGLDGGLVYRPLAELDLVVGAGAHRFAPRGHATEMGASVLGGIRFAPALRRAGPRLRVAAELRRDLHPSLELATEDHKLREVARTTSFFLSLGLELSVRGW